ncbi:SDR family NAD(P)-dependent oxidoreductase [Streptomyces sp. NPDC059009]|uniref:SDR family NAD(P)-dependent oxidoreductase n=1 Tax=Streptomyces sp. NPDC059009 TaxID=3346694 RepID=UPI0036CED1B1
MPIRNVLITGGSAGIGRACVERFAREEDWAVWFTYRQGRTRAEELIAELARDGRAKVAAFPFDQGDWDDHQRLLRELPGPVDVLINNAAVGSKTIEHSVQGPEHTKAPAFFQINAVGPLWLTQQVLPGMLERGGGKIINVSSVGGGVFQFPGFHPADGMSKAALTYLTRHLAADLVHTPVQVFALCPGAVATDMFESSTLAPLDAARREDLTARLPQGRMIRPEEIADLAWWLAGDHSAALHGAVIDASMGLGVHPALLTADSVPGPVPGPAPDDRTETAAVTEGA